MAKNYYQVLGLSQQASEQEIKRSYRQLAMKLHPDSNPDQNAHALFLQLNEAYQTLSDPQLKRRYDIQLQRFQAGDIRAFENRKVYRRPASPTSADPDHMSDEERRRRYQEAKIRQKKAEYAEFKRYSPYVKILSGISMGLVCIFLLDWGFGKRSDPEQIIELVQTYEPGFQLVCLIKTAQRSQGINCNRVSLLREDDYLSFHRTPLFGKTYRISVLAQYNGSVPDNTDTVRSFYPKPSLYNIFSFFWIMLIASALGGIYFDKKPELQFRFGLSMAGLLPLTLLMLYLA